MILRKLKSLRSAPVPPEALEAGRARLIEAMRLSPMPVTSLASDVTRAPVSAFAWRPIFASVVGVAVLSGSGTVMAAHGSVPGDRLYPVKLAAEETRMRMALSDGARFRVRAAHAGHRLEEAADVMARAELSEEERGERMNQAMARYEDHLMVMTALAVRGGVEPRAVPKPLKALRAVDVVLEKQEALIVSATGFTPSFKDLVLKHVEGALELNDDVLSSASVRDRRGKKDGDAPSVIEARMRTRADRLKVILEKRDHDAEEEKGREERRRADEDEDRDDGKERRDDDRDAPHRDQLPDPILPPIRFDTKIEVGTRL